MLYYAYRMHSRNPNVANPISTTRGVIVVGVLALLIGLYNVFLPDSAWRRTHRKSEATGPTAYGRKWVRIGGVLALVIGIVLLIGAALGKK